MSNTTALIRQTIEVQSKTASKIESRLKSMPEGCLYRSVKSTNSYYYHCISRNGVKTRRYIGTAKGKNAQLIADLKRKRFLLYCKKVLEENVVALSACLLKYEEFDPSEISNRMAASYENITDGQVSSRVEQDDCTNGRPEAKEATQKQQSLEYL